ncbi:MAG: hypothetical protein IPO76_09910 [Elusimicrobia bacterium]|jgi:hypothetical protein|nr:hypothetical protein [Elusimicrobiota bacterium]MBK9695688.1 hypothetical protein [Elusimicrobiota bacterium]MBL0250069.1 hypothetical protein [Elusimicrobiota bacterium]
MIRIKNSFGMRPGSGRAEVGDERADVRARIYWLKKRGSHVVVKDRAQLWQF